MSLPRPELPLLVSSKPCSVLDLSQPNQIELRYPSSNSTLGTGSCRRTGIKPFKSLPNGSKSPRRPCASGSSPGSFAPSTSARDGVSRIQILTSSFVRGKRLRVAAQDAPSGADAVLPCEQPQWWSKLMTRVSFQVSPPPSVTLLRSAPPSPAARSALVGRAITRRNIALPTDARSAFRAGGKGNHEMKHCPSHRRAQRVEGEGVSRRVSAG
jgi:hypothetical protein